MNTAIRNFFLSHLLVIICGYSLFAQDSIQQFKYNFSQFGNETWGFIKQPTKWNGSDWLKLGLIGAGTFLILEIADEPIGDVVLKNLWWKSLQVFHLQSQFHLTNAPWWIKTV